MKNLNINSGNAKLRGTNIDQIKLASEAGNSNVGRLCITFKDGTKRSYKITLRNSSRTVSEEALSNFITKVIIHNQANFKARKSIDFDKKSGSSVIKKTVDSQQVAVVNQAVKRSFQTLAKMSGLSSTVDGGSTSLPLPDPTGADDASSSVHDSTHTSSTENGIITLTGDGEKLTVTIQDTAGNTFNKTIKEAGFFSRLFKKTTAIRVGGKDYTVVTSNLESKITKVYQQALGIKKTKKGRFGRRKVVVFNRKEIEISKHALKALKRGVKYLVSKQSNLTQMAEIAVDTDTVATAALDLLKDSLVSRGGGHTERYARDEDGGTLTRTMTITGKRGEEDVEVKQKVVRQDNVLTRALAQIDNELSSLREAVLSEPRKIAFLENKIDFLEKKKDTLENQKKQGMQHVSCNFARDLDGDKALLQEIERTPLEFRDMGVSAPINLREHSLKIRGQQVSSCQRSGSLSDHYDGSTNLNKLALEIAILDALDVDEDVSDNTIISNAASELEIKEDDPVLNEMYERVNAGVQRELLAKLPKVKIRDNLIKDLMISKKVSWMKRKTNIRHMALQILQQHLDSLSFDPNSLQMLTKTLSITQISALDVSKSKKAKDGLDFVHNERNQQIDQETALAYLSGKDIVFDAPGNVPYVDNKGIHMPMSYLPAAQQTSHQTWKLRTYSFNIPPQQKNSKEAFAHAQMVNKVAVNDALGALDLLKGEFNSRPEIDDARLKLRAIQTKLKTIDKGGDEAYDLAADLYAAMHEVSRMGINCFSGKDRTGEIMRRAHIRLTEEHGVKDVATQFHNEGQDMAVAVIHSETGKRGMKLSHLKWLKHEPIRAWGRRLWNAAMARV